MDHQTALRQYTLHLADNALIMGQRLSGWTGHGPVLEQDIAMSNIALDHIGQARNWFQLSGRLHEPEKTEDQLAYLRKEREYLNLLICELPNGDFAQTIARQFFYDQYHYYRLQSLIDCENNDIASIARKSIKEVAYHKKWSAEWLIRLGDGTEESHNRMQRAIHDLWPYADEHLQPADYETSLIEEGLIDSAEKFMTTIREERKDILQRATLDRPEEGHTHTGGKEGIHTEHMGHLLSDLQYMQRVYPDAQW